MPQDSTTNSNASGDAHGPTFAVPRSRGALSGLTLVALGVWGAFLPLIGPRFHFGVGPDHKLFDFTAPRLWLQILPGVVAAVAGLFVLLGGNRITGTAWAYLAAAAGAWFVVGPILADLRSAGYVGQALGGNDRAHIGGIAAFYGLGSAIIFFAALAAGRLSVVGVRDVQTKQKRHDSHENNGMAEPATAAIPVPARRVSAKTTHVRPVRAEPTEATGAVLDPDSRT